MHNTQFIIWKYLTNCWTEVGVDSLALESLTKQLKQQHVAWGQIENIIFKQVLWRFSWVGLGFLMLWIPLLGLILMTALIPDWEYEDERIQQKIKNFQKYRWMYWLNPLCWIGYPIAYCMSYAHIQELKRHFNRA